MEIAICKIRPKAWAEFQERQQRITNRSGKDAMQEPMPLYYGGGRYLFTPSCELPPNIARGLAKRHNGELVEIVEFVQQKKRSGKVNRKNSEQRYLCSFCDKEYQMIHHRNNHEEKCKGD